MSINEIIFVQFSELVLVIKKEQRKHQNKHEMFLAGQSRMMELVSLTKERR